jgi:hypothetical protein
MDKIEGGRKNMNAMTLKDFRSLSRRDFDNDAVIDEIDAALNEREKLLKYNNFGHLVQKENNNQFEDFIIVGTFIKFEIESTLEVKTIVRRVKEKDHITAMELFNENTKNLYLGYKKLPLTVLRTYQIIDC